MEFFQEQEKNRIRQAALKTTTLSEEAELKKLKANFDENAKIFREEENFNVEQKVNEWNDLLKDRLYKKVEQHEKIIKNLKGIISKN